MAVICVSVQEVVWCECTEFHLGTPCGFPVLGWEVDVRIIPADELEPDFLRYNLEEALASLSLPPPSLSEGAPSRRPPTTQQNSYLPPPPPMPWTTAGFSRLQKKWGRRRGG